MDTSIFNDTNKVKSNWAKWNAVGDEIAGTFVSKREVMNRASGMMQWVYELLLDDDSVWNVGGKPAVDAQMRNIKLGQIICFRFMEEVPSKVTGRNATKIIQVFAPKDLVNKEWLAKKEEEDAAGAGTDGEKETPIDQIPGFEGKDKVDPATLNKDTDVEVKDKLELINAIAKEKLGVEPSEVKLKVMEVTGLAFSEANFDAIIEKLNAHK